MSVHEITQQQIWDSFIERVAPSTFLHSWMWGEFESSLGRQIFRLGVFDGEKLICVAFASIIKARRGKFLLCPHGPIVADNSQLQKSINEIASEFKEIGKREKCDFVRISTLSIDSFEHREVFKKVGFRNAPIHMHSELAWVLDVTPDEDKLLSGMKKNTRYSIRKAERDGVSVRVSTSMDDFEIFWNVYQNTAERQKFTPYSKDYLKKEFELFFGNNQAVLFFGEYQNTVISTAFIVYANGSGFYHHGASNNPFPGITASELVQWRAIQEAKRRGMKRYNFWGIVPESATKHPWHGLSKFKRSFGGFEEAYVHAQDMVLTVRYWFNVIVETVRKMRRRL